MNTGQVWLRSYSIHHLVIEMDAQTEFPVTHMLVAPMFDPPGNILSLTIWIVVQQVSQLPQLHSLNFHLQLNAS